MLEDDEDKRLDYTVASALQENPSIAYSDPYYEGFHDLSTARNRNGESHDELRTKNCRSDKNSKYLCPDSDDKSNFQERQQRSFEGDKLHEPDQCRKSNEDNTRSGLADILQYNPSNRKKLFNTKNGVGGKDHS